MPSAPSYNSTPSEARLRRAVDARFLMDGASDAEAEALLRQYPAAALRHIAERRDKRLLAAALRSGIFPPEAAERLSERMNTLPFALRLLLSRPELAREVPPPETARSASADGDADIESRLRRWQFNAGVEFPFLRERVTAMPCGADRHIDPFGTDGLCFYYNSAPVGEDDFRHMLMHCIFRHMLPPEKTQRPLWDLACDMSAEFLREELFPSGRSREVQYGIAGALPDSCDPRSAASVYRGLLDLYADELEILRRRYVRDDHRFWYERPEKPPALPGSGQGEGGGFAPGTGGESWTEQLGRVLADRWEDAAQALVPEKKGSKRFGLSPGSREEKMLLRQAAKYDFSRYLRRFSILREELQLDESSFDYIPYCYGLERYGNLPLIEPLEYTESYKIAQLVIAIDTSGSCSRQIVERFMAEIERILMRRENFFKKMDIHIIQCDAIIQDHVRIRAPEDWKRYLKGLTIKGRGGTSFIPVFNLVEKLRAAGELKDLKGLLYFTDGDGAYPRRGPDYEVAFVFPDRESLRPSLPDWIMPLCLEP